MTAAWVALWWLSGALPTLGFAWVLAWKLDRKYGRDRHGCRFVYGDVLLSACFGAAGPVAAVVCIVAAVCLVASALIPPGFWDRPLCRRSRS